VATTLAISCQSPQPGGATTVSPEPVTVPANPEARPTDPVAPKTETSAGLQRSDEVIAEKKSKLIKPRERDEEWFRPRAGVDGEFTWAEVMLAKEHIDQMPELRPDDGQRDAGIWAWEWLGPANIGGRIRSILIHPTNHDTMWVGGVSGGIWKTTNGGVNWDPINDFLPTLAVGALAMDPTNPAIMYAGTGEMTGSAWSMPGAGILKSTNGGSTWTQLPDTTGWDWVNRIAIDAGNGNHMLAATDTGIYHSDDGGDTWNQRFSSPIGDVRFDPTDGSKAVAGSCSTWDSSDGFILYSTNGGWDWSPATFDSAPSTTTVAVAFTPDGNSDDDTITVASSDSFIKSEDIWIGSGATRENRRVYDIPSSTEITVGDLQHPHAVGEAVENERNSRVELAYAPSNPSIVYASMDASKGTIWRSFNGGHSFHVQSNGTENYLGSQGYYDHTIWVAPDDPAFVVVGGISLWRSTDGGYSLTRISSMTGWEAGTAAHADHHIILEHPLYSPSNRTVFVGNDGGIQKTNNITTVTVPGGWVNLGTDLGITQFYGGAASPDGEWIMGGTQDNDTAHRQSTSAPGEWFGTVVTDGGFCAIDYDDPINPIFYKEAQNLVIKKSTDLGQSYTTVVNGLLDSDTASRFIAPFVLDPNDSTVLIAGGESIWRTVDSAGYWFSIRDPISDGGGSPSISALDIASGNGTRIWVGYDNYLTAAAATGRVSRTTTSTTAWEDVDENGPTPLPDRMVEDIAISPHNNDEVFVVFAGYETDNVWFTDDNGATWQQRTGAAPNDLPALHINTVRWHPVSNWWVYIGTDLGIFASEDKGLTWSRTPVGPGHEGPANTIVSELFWQGDYLIAATHGRGMYRCRPLVHIFVDWTNTGFEDGTWMYPFNTVTEALDASGSGTETIIHTGDYDEAGVIRFERRSRVSGIYGAVIIR
jgi:photosystem II stability/assembly factor-like uncharacterized protein